MRFKINEYDTIETGRYNGKFQIKIGRVGKDDKFYQDFKIVKKKDGSEIKVPVTMTFDNDDDATHLFYLCECELKGLDHEKVETPDIPF